MLKSNKFMWEKFNFSLFLFLLLYYITYSNIHKNCKKLPAKMNRWKIECIYLCLLPNAYRIAPTVYAIPPASNYINPFFPNNSGNKFAFTIIHHPIIK